MLTWCKVRVNARARTLMRVFGVAGVNLEHVHQEAEGRDRRQREDRSLIFIDGKIRFCLQP